MNIKFLYVAALAALTLSSCGSDDNTPESNKLGVKTMATVSLTQKGASSRATEAATPSEKTVENATLYVFTSAGALEKIVVLDVTANIASKTFEITSGTKSFYAVCNMNSALVALGTSIPAQGDAKSKVLKTLMSITSIASITADNNFWLTSTSEKTQTILEGIDEATATAGTTPAANYVVIEVGRAAAKVDVNFTAGENTTDQPGGYLTSVTYRVKNLPKAMYLLPYDLATTLTSPYYGQETSGNLTANYWENTDNSASNMYVNATHTSKLVTGVASYAVENINQNVLVGNTTYISIKGVFTPTLWLNAAGAPTTALTTGNTFWRLQDTSNGTFAADYYTASPTIVPSGYAAVEYTDGVCYYRMNIADNTQSAASDIYRVLRNHVYKLNITSVSGAGTKTEIDPVDPTDPTDPIAKNTWMKGVIEVIDWVVVDQSGGI